MGSLIYNSKWRNGFNGERLELLWDALSLGDVKENWGGNVYLWVKVLKFSQSPPCPLQDGCVASWIRKRRTLLSEYGDLRACDFWRASKAAPLHGNGSKPSQWEHRTVWFRWAKTYYFGCIMKSFIVLQTFAYNRPLDQGLMCSVQRALSWGLISVSIMCMFSPFVTLIHNILTCALEQ